ncbi:MAG: hypothetical protein FWE33_00665 [Defluviitaleaceae bacterium]|nr:hypothetical protein [Defluviitaleaceae bacterium]
MMKKFFRKFLALSLVFAITLPIGTSIAAQPIAINWGVLNPYLAALENGNPAAIVTTGRNVINFWLDGQTPEQAAARFTLNPNHYRYPINGLWTTPNEVARAAMALGDLETALWAYRIAYIFADVYEALIPFLPHGDVAEMEFARTQIRNIISTLDVEITVFAEIRNDSGLTSFTGALHEPQTGVFFGEPFGSDFLTNGLRQPSVTTIYVEFEDIHLPTAVGFGLNQNQALHGYLRNDYSFVQVAWNFPREGNQIPSVMQQTLMITEAAQFLGELNIPILLRIGGEMDVWTHLPNRDEFIDAFRHIANIMRQYAPNVAMVYSVNAISAQGVDWMTFYPGETYVDWVGISLYTNKYAFGNPAHFDDAMAQIYRTGRYANPVQYIRDLVDAFGGRHPLLISEGAVALYSLPNAEDITDWALPRMRAMYSYIPILFPQVKAMIWFNVDIYSYGNGTQRYYFGASPRARDLYHQLTNQEHFLGRGQTGSPITYAPLGTATMPANNVVLLTYAPFFTMDNVRVEYRLDGELLGQSTDIPYRGVFDLSGVTDGQYALQVRVFNGNDFLAASDFNLVKTSSNVTITSGTPTQTTNQGGETPVGALGNVMHTNIRVFIDGVQIQGYNIYDNTFIVVEDLSAYGFDVQWNAATSTLTVGRGTSTVQPRAIPSGQPTTGIAFPYLATNVVAYVLGQRVDSYNIDGFTVIQIDRLAEIADHVLQWNSEQATLSMITR